MMQPLDAMDETGIRALAGVAFDVDDTITDHGRLTSRALRALERLADTGLRLVAVTGRPLGWVEVWMAQWPIDVGIGENGAGWFVRRDGGLVRRYHRGRDPGELAARRASALALGQRLAPEVPVPDDGWARRCDAAFDVGERRRASEAERVALERGLREAGFHVVTSSIHLHAASDDWDKAKGLVGALHDAFGMDLAGPDRDRWLFVGDSPNDAAAFAHFPWSVAVANVEEHGDVDFVRPRFRTREARSAGFAELAEHLVSIRSRT